MVSAVQKVDLGSSNGDGALEAISEAVLIAAAAETKQ